MAILGAEKPVADDDTLIRLSDKRYQELVANKTRVETALAHLDDFRLWLQAVKGTSDLEAGLRLCTTGELWEWLQREYETLSWNVPMNLAEEVAERVMAREAEELRAREEEQLRTYHIDPWEGRTW